MVGEFGNSQLFVFFESGEVFIHVHRYLWSYVIAIIQISILRFRIVRGGIRLGMNYYPGFIFGYGFHDVEGFVADNFDQLIGVHAHRRFIDLLTL